MSGKGKITLKAYSIPELAALYGVCDRTFNKWTKPFMPQIGEKKGRFYTIAQVKIIFSALGLPGEIALDE